MGAPSQPTVQCETYATDRTDTQWEQIRPYVAVQAKTGPKRRGALRAVRNGLLDKLKTGCQWELLPRSFPAKRTVHYSFQQWTKKGIWVRINDALRRRVRVEVEGRENVAATGGMIDTQSAKSSVAGGPERGFDGGKKVYGRKRRLLTDTLGLLITAVVHSAQLYDGAGAKKVFAATKARGIRLKKVWADQIYRGVLRPWMAEPGMGELEIVERLPGQRGFAVQPKRWVVERTHAWLSGNRQLSRAYDHHPRHSESWLYLASIRLLGRRLAKVS
ncbi:MAG: IS5 family transposase [Chloroflexales bacterium]|nr:IS5 family transposase [Chloroflexales bacterium]